MIAALLLLGGCGVGNGRPKPADHPGDSPAVDSDSAVDSRDSGPIDADADGYGADVDCDDQDPAVHPDATDVCNGADDDCDGAIDEDAPEWHIDSDGDGYGGAEVVQACEAPPDAADDGSDCDDTDSEIHLGAVEWCGDGVDQDCDRSDSTCALAADAASLGAAVLGDRPDHWFGVFQMGVGDLNGDGLGDLVAGAWAMYSGVAGYAYVMSSPMDGEISVAEADALLHCGDDSTPSCGYGVAVVGDVDGDEVADVVVGNPTSLSATAAVLYHGPVSGTLGVSSAATVWTRDVGNEFGGDIVGGDLDGDGLADVVIDDAHHSSGFAAALIFKAPFSSTITEDEADARLFAGGHDVFPDHDSVSVRGDLDGDGYADLLFARYVDATYAHDSGAVYVYRGPFAEDRQPTQADAVVYGTDEFQFLGQSADFCGDQNGDGRDDIVVGSATGGGHERAVYVLTSPFSGARVMPGDADGVLVGRVQPDFLGAFLEYMDDLDADGFGDIVVTAWGADSNGVDSGSAYVLFGPLLGIQDASAAASLELRGEAGDGFGAVTGSGDVDGDGVTDLLVGAPYHGRAGAVYVFKGADLVAQSGR